MSANILFMQTIYNWKWWAETEEEQTLHSFSLTLISVDGCIFGVNWKKIFVALHLEKEIKF